MDRELCLAVMAHLAGLCIDGPTRDSDGCGLVHEARLCDDAEEGHGRHGWSKGVVNLVPISRDADRRIFPPIKRT